MAFTIPTAVCETPTFRRSAAAIMPDDEIEELIDFVAASPTAGVVIPATGGMRKLRWRRPGTGKRGGARVIYFYCDESMPLLMILAYAKSASDDMAPEQKRRARALIREYIGGHRKRGKDEAVQN
jgi:hypothetical protein